MAAASRLARARPSPSRVRTAGSNACSRRPMKRSTEACGRCASREPSVCTLASHVRGGAATAGHVSAASVKTSSNSSSLHGASVCRQLTNSLHTPARRQSGSSQQSFSRQTNSLLHRLMNGLEDTSFPDLDIECCHHSASQKSATPRHRGIVSSRVSMRAVLRTRDRDEHYLRPGPGGLWGGGWRLKVAGRVSVAAPGASLCWPARQRP